MEIIHSSTYANDTAGNWATPQTVTFHVHVLGDAVPENPVAVIAVIALILAAIILLALAVLVAYRRHRKTFFFFFFFFFFIKHSDS